MVTFEQLVASLTVCDLGPPDAFPFGVQEKRHFRVSGSTDFVVVLTAQGLTCHCAWEGEGACPHIVAVERVRRRPT